MVAVHLFGQMADLDRVTPLVQRHGIALIEDAAQAHGARFGGRRAGSVGIVTAPSSCCAAGTAEPHDQHGRQIATGNGSMRFSH